MFGQIDGVEIACNIGERPEHGTCVHEANWLASFTDYRSEHQSSIEAVYFEKAGSEKIDIETDVRDSE